MNLAGGAANAAHIGTYDPNPGARWLLRVKGVAIGDESVSIGACQSPWVST
jgi:hypothetical protein